MQDLSRTRRDLVLLGVVGCALLAGPSGCDAPDGTDDGPSDLEDWEFPSWEKDDSLGDGPSRTSDANAQIFRGYNVVTDAVLGDDCVAPDEERYVAGATEWAETITIVSSSPMRRSALQRPAHPTSPASAGRTTSPVCSSGPSSAC